jgi:aspartyl-tRNA synthetase
VCVASSKHKKKLFSLQSISTGACEIAVEEFCRIVLPIAAPESSNSFGDQQQRSYSTTAKSRGITSIEYKKSASENIVKYFVNREVTCGELRKDDVGRVVTMVGWLDSKKHGKFLQLKDGYGITQILIDSEDLETRQTVANVQENSIIQVKGRVIARPPMMVRNNSETGEIEMLVTDFKILDPKAEYLNADGETEKEMEVDTENSASQSQAPQQISPRIEKPKINLYTYRTHNCGELNDSNIGQEITLTGWLEFHRMRKFFTLRDGYGCTQVIIPDELCNHYNIESIPFESILKVSGLVLARPIGTINETMATGNIEVVMKSLVVLNEAKKNLPIEMRTFNRSKENLRLEYRYIDLRFSDMQKNLRTRSKVLMKMREYLINHCGFVEVETPTLFRRTPGGAQEFVVPSRKAGKFYSLVQSPQQFKQMLMVGAIDRYFQIARCYRDEATRPDRQPEFTQLDIELSFTDRESIMSMVEAILVNCWPESNGSLSTPFQKMTYDEAMEKYGTDKPDLRFDMQLQNVTNLVALNEEMVKSTPGLAAYAIVLKHPQSNVRNQLKKELKDLEKDLRAHVVVSKIAAETVMDWVEGPLKNLFTSVVLKALAANLHLEPEDLLVISYGKKSDCVS